MKYISYITCTLRNSCHLYVGSNIVAVVDSKRKSLYHVTCEVLVPPTRESSRCTFCSSHRNTLRAILSRTTKDDRTNPSSHTNYTALSTPEKVKCLHRLHLEAKNTRQKLDRLKNRIGLATAIVNVDKALDSDLRLTISEHDENVKYMYMLVPESFFGNNRSCLPQKSTINEVAPSLQNGAYTSATFQGRTSKRWNHSFAITTHFT